jgi:hypothetical protein
MRPARGSGEAPGVLWKPQLRHFCPATTRGIVSPSMKNNDPMCSEKARIPTLPSEKQIHVIQFKEVAGA